MPLYCPQALGVIVTTNKKYSLQASGWNANLIATGPSIGVIVSSAATVPSGVSGTVRWSALLQINENKYT